MDILSEVLGETPEAVDAPVVQAPEPEANESGGPARGADGKFVAKEPEPAPAEAVAASAPAAAPAVQASAPAVVADPTTPPPGFVPLSALQGIRDETKELKEQLRRLTQPQPAPQPAFEPTPPPSVFEDEAAFQAYQAQQLQSTALNIRLDLSEDMARGKHGDDKVNAVQQWFAEKAQQSPTFRQEVLAQRNPYEYAIALQERETALATINTDDFAAFQAWKAAQSGQAPAIQPASAQAAAPPVKAPTPSLASASSAGGFQHVPTGPGQAFDALFKGT
jgi:hypothetical protein